MALEMRASCELCEKQIEMDQEAYICSYECTFCPTCTAGQNGICPNCGGELVKRPKRIKINR
ncbi:DUF1272 domain-containing protein [Brevibacillus choshinensis]|uniref:DUF1272 domain-containing protein n=1 Tax=Brevibacillus choshinensis TaxID=54911 RepID=UPI0009F82E3C|nr:DUF1272 domain-containing protein [Brevibacillus choshinensis]MED4586093.1 DUF1272 domain-containing protein [Brevibacillus choshinensis]MED4752216.1 DUF1272 domain-containing protein [Brevibacillus choshinensis]MED4784647.1 DUF1272 domain-containing protein [Brevibacillus choshinensis]